MKHVIATAILLTVAATSCGTRNVDAFWVESKITHQMIHQGFGVQAVTCPHDMTLEQGKTFHCIAKTFTRTRYYVEVTIESGDGPHGQYTWIVR